ncbi:uncharacterized protein LOC143885806 [Tasmannia lanceolata]|uniref:uncharacterized protein LOC143885806 n=1 Tax=Tasmannia lanceolata TaxID=3420 RepID=UPI0040628F50
MNKFDGVWKGKGRDLLLHLRRRAQLLAHYIRQNRPTEEESELEQIFNRYIHFSLLEYTYSFAMSLLPTEDDGNGDDGGMNLAIQGCALVAAGTAVALAAVIEEQEAFFECSPYENTYLTPRTFLPYALRTDEHCHDLLRMNVECFTRFVHILKGTGRLTDTLHCSVEEQFDIFLHIISHDLRNRCMKAYFRRSGETVSRYFSKVLDAIMSLSDLLIKPPSPDTPAQIRANGRLYPYFKNCIGAVDGTHIRAKVPFDTRGRFLCRKGWTSQNVLAACDFD